jgi:hypothetical protein
MSAKGLAYWETMGRNVVRLAGDRLPGQLNHQNSRANIARRGASRQKLDTETAVKPHLLTSFLALRCFLRSGGTRLCSRLCERLVNRRAAGLPNFVKPPLVRGLPARTVLLARPLGRLRKTSRNSAQDVSATSGNRADPRALAPSMLHGYPGWPPYGHHPLARQPSFT